MKNNIPQKCLKLAMKYKGIVSGIKTSKMSAKICKITFPGPNLFDRIGD
jgi:hypothetical protein